MFIPGGHGPVFDLAHNPACGRLILAFLKQGKPVGSVCHGPASFIAAAELRPGLLNGKRLTSFTNEEERVIGRSGKVPFLLETRLKQLGANFHSNPVPFAADVQVDGLLITGQNPISAGPAATAEIEVLERTGRL